MSIAIPTAEIEAAASTDASRPVLTQVAVQRVHGTWYLAATDSYILAAVPIDNPGPDTDEGLVPGSMIVRARKALADARKRYKRYSNVAEDDVTLSAKDGKVRLGIENADFDGCSSGTLNIEAKRMDGTFPSVQQLIDQTSPSIGSQVAYGTMRVTFNATLLLRLAKALGATQGRGRNAHSIVTLDLPINEDGSVNPLRAMRVQPGAVDNGAIGVLMPVRESVDRERALAAWPKAKPQATPKPKAAKSTTAKKPAAKMPTARKKATAKA